MKKDFKASRGQAVWGELAHVIKARQHEFVILPGQV